LFPRTVARFRRKVTRGSWAAGLMGPGGRGGGFIAQVRRGFIAQVRRGFIAQVRH